MERWSGRVALVTGAGSGIGAAIAESLVKHGLTVIGVDLNNYVRIQEMVKELRNASGKLHAFKVDVSKEEDIVDVFDWVRENLGGVDIAVNCAAIYGDTDFADVRLDLLQKIYNVNVIGLTIVNREALKSMKERGVDDGHVINIDSITGHFPPIDPKISLYASTKHAVKVLSEGLRRELVQQKSNIRITNVSPGCVDTALLRQSAPDRYEDIAKLNPEDIANGVIYALSTPPHVQVHELTIRPVGDFYP